MVNLNTIGYSEKIMLSNGRYFKHLTLEELKELGFENYYLLIFAFCTRPYDLRAQLWKNEIDYETIGRYELFNQLFLRHFFITEDENSKEEDKLTSKNFIKFMENILYVKQLVPLVMNKEKQEVIYVDYVEEDLVIDEKIFYEISEIVVALSNHEYEKEEAYKNKTSKEMILESLVDDLETNIEKDKDSITFFSLITSVILNAPYTYKTVLELNLYQFFQLISKSFKRENSQAIKQGIYSGTIDGKKINAKDYNWLL